MTKLKSKSDFKSLQIFSIFFSYIYEINIVKKIRKEFKKAHERYQNHSKEEKKKT